MTYLVASKNLLTYPNNRPWPCVVWERSVYSVGADISLTTLHYCVGEMENATEILSTVWGIIQEQSTVLCAYYAIALLLSILLSANMWNHLKVTQ